MLERLVAAGLRAYLVGGAVRDLLLGRDARDFDVLVPEGIDAARKVLPEARSIDALVPVLLLRDEGGGSLEIIGLRGDACDVNGDLALRDFTLNAIGLEAGSGRLIDPLGGRTDLDERRLRAPEPERCFRDDPVRILRGARFESELSLELDGETERGMERDAVRLTHAPGERKRDELMRVLALPDPTSCLERLRRLGALSVLLPELLRGVAVDQNRHHPDDVYRHTLRACALVPQTRPLVRLATLLHDAAKPETKRATDSAAGTFRFLRHEHAAMAHVRTASQRLRLSGRAVDRVERLVRHHLVYPDRLTTPASRRRLVRRVGRDILDDLLLLRRADLASRSPDSLPGAAWEETEACLRREASAAGARAPRLAITGRMIMRELDLEEGPEVGRLLRRARRRVTEDPTQNTREALLAWLRASLSRDEDL